MKYVCDNRGIRLTLYFSSDRINDIIAIPVIQFIIGDCKGNNLLCGRQDEYSINMKGLCRDYMVKPSDGDDTWIGEYLLFTFYNLCNVVVKTKEQLDEYSFYQSIIIFTT